MKTEGKLGVILGVVVAVIVAAFFLLRGQSGQTTVPGPLAGGPRVSDSATEVGNRRTADNPDVVQGLDVPGTGGTQIPLTVNPVPTTLPAGPTTSSISVGISTQPSYTTTQPSMLTPGNAVGGVTPPVGAGTASNRPVDWNALLAGASTTPASPAGSGLSGPTGPRVGGVTPGAGAGLPPVGPGLSGSGSTSGSTYTVKPGDSFSRISAAVYGSPNYWAKIAQANPNVNSNRLRVGQVLVIPPESEVKALNATPAPARTEGVTGSSLVLDPTREYRVISGDSLHRISQRLYGTGERWEEIYRLNQSVIGSSPTKLKIGMVLKLPAAPSAGVSTRP